MHALQLAEAVEQQRRPQRSRVNWHSDVWKLQASTIPRVFLPVLVITIWATFIAFASLVLEGHLGLTNNVVPLLSVVVALLLVFRTNTAYARWQEGRMLFSNMSNGVRNLARTTWCFVGAAPEDLNRLDPNGRSIPYTVATFSESDRREKIAALRFLVAFVVASKHHVRGEYETAHADLQVLLPSGFLERFRLNGYPDHLYGKI